VPEVVPRLGLTLPGVFLQGLLITDAQGNVLHSRCVFFVSVSVSLVIVGIMFDILLS
jgi:hypothetical protein